MSEILGQSCRALPVSQRQEQGKRRQMLCTVSSKHYCTATTAPRNAGYVPCVVHHTGLNGDLHYGADGVPCFLNTASIAACAHFSPSALDTPIEPITSPSTTIGKAPGCGKSCMKVGARFWPVRTILFISEVGRRQRSADFAFSSAVSMALAAAPSMAWDSIRFPAQSNTDIASVK